MKNPKRVVFAFLVLCLAGGGIFAAYYPCYHDIYCIEKRDPWLAVRLNRTVPLFWTDTQTYEPPVKLPPFPKQVWDIFDRNVKTFEAFQEEHRKAGPISCAVVANGSTLLDSGYGDAIDTHDYIFRMNSAPTVGFEKDVGTRTTFNILQGHAAVIHDYGPGVFPVMWGKGGGKESIADQLMGKPGKYLQIESLVQPVMLDSPEFEDSYMLRNWFLPAQKLSKDGEWPSTGFRTIVLALHLCNSVDLYGFGPDAQERWRYYYNKGVGFWQGHRSDYQEDFIHTLVEHGIARRYKGNLDADPNAYLKRIGK